MQLIDLKKKRYLKKQFCKVLLTLVGPSRVPRFWALGALIINRLGVSSNLANKSVQAKFQLIGTIHLARAMGVVRNLPAHLIFGGLLYMTFTVRTGEAVSW